MTITHLRTGPKLSRIVIHHDMVYLCGMVANDYDGDIQEQTRQTLERIDEHLAEAGTDKSKILTATVYIKDITEAAAMNEIWNEWLKEHPRPARTCVEAGMAKPEIRVEITVTATKS